ncbi:hypothetical protein PUND_a3114 [Pseudoalteromonas undina]|nr:hypothetical protein PUND_a3114 [Pseudoalteromonas undina]
MPNSVVKQNSSEASPAQGRPDTMIVWHLLCDFLPLWAP